MALADLDTVKKRLIQLLNANPGAWSASVSGNVGAFFSDSEITQACLEADSNIAGQGYANSVNDSLANPFQVTTAPFSDRDNLPFHKGDLSKVELSTNVITLTTTDINTTSNVITSVAHGLVTGNIVSWVIISGGLPSPFAVLTNYYVIRLTADTFQLATSMNNALTPSPIDILTTGSGSWLLIAWQVGVEAKSLDEITNATNGMNAYVSGTSTNPTAYNFIYKPSDGLLYTTARYWRATHFEYTQTAALQCNQNETSLLVFEAAAILVKNASPALFNVYRGYADRGIQQLITDGQYTAQVNEAGVPSPST